MSETAQLVAVIIDDDARQREFMAEVAALSGYQTISASDGSELAKVMTSFPDVVILDLAMERVDGIEVIRQLAANCFAGRLIIVSGFNVPLLQSARTLAELQGLKVAGVLSKPIRVDSLRQFLQVSTQAKFKPKSEIRVNLEDLAQGIANDHLILHYQPQVRLSDGAWVGLEALVRWQHPQYGLLPPQAFIGMTETMGLALPLTQKVIEMAMDACYRLSGLVDYQGTMSINLPPAAMTDLRIPEMVTTMAVKAACDAERLQFEITETSLPPDPAKAIDILARMRLKGFALSIDDFGTGHSSLEQLRKLPFSELKIDLSFVRGAETDIAARVIVENSIELGRQLNLAVLAEGVENEVIWRWLRDVGCELAQGFFVAKPMPLEHLLSWHHEWREKMSDLNQYTERLAPNSANAEA